MENQFISLQGLADKLAQQIHSLYDGQSKKDQLESMVENARDLYERLVVLRHKAYEQELEVRAISFELEAPSMETNIAPMEEDNAGHRQVSLMDIIEEMKTEESTEETSLSFSPFSADLASEVQEVEEEDNLEVIELDIPQEIKDEVAREEATPIYSLNDLIGQQQQPNTVFAQLGKSPIDDLKKAITLNQQFQFTRELFDGDTEQYLITISELNALDTEKVEDKVQDLIRKRGWMVDSIAFIELRELIQRRHGV
jgi:hypothetical protein